MANANIKTSELTIKDSPSTSATMVGVDNGETVQIPISVLATSGHEHSEYAKTTDIPSLEGYAKTTDLFSKSYNDLTDKPTIPSIDGLATEQYVNDKVASMSGSTSSGGGASIIYATELPSTPQQAIYVITEDEVVSVVIYGEDGILPPEMVVVEIVDVLPDNPNLMMNATTGAFYMYYLTTENVIYGYADDEIAVVLEVGSAGWYDMNGIIIAGIVSSVDEVEPAFALLTTEPKTRVYVPMPDGAFLELTSGIRTRFDENSGTVSITEM